MTCVTCKYYRGGVNCAAFPMGIPEEILTGAVSHGTPYPGDQGICYQASGTTAGVSAFQMTDHPVMRPLDPIELPTDSPGRSLGHIPKNVLGGFLFLLLSFAGVAVVMHRSGYSPLQFIYLFFATVATINLIRQQWWAWFIIILTVITSMGFSVVGIIMLHARVLLLPLALGCIELYLLLTDPP